MVGVGGGLLPENGRRDDMGKWDAIILRRHCSVAVANPLDWKVGMRQ